MGSGWWGGRGGTGALGSIGALGPGRGRRDDGMCSVGRVNVFSFGGDVSSFWANVFSFGGNVFSFWPDVFTFRSNVFTLAGQVFSEEGERSEGRAVRRTWRKARFAPSASSGQASAGSGQVLRGRRDDGDVSTLSGQCVQFLARCVNFSAECVQSLPKCVQFPAECVR